MSSRHPGLYSLGLFYIIVARNASSPEAPLSVSPDTLPPPQTARPRRRFATPRVIVALVLREMSTRYGSSPGGYIWAVLEPLGAIMILGIGFSLLVRTPSLGSSFILFYASGYLPFSLYQGLQNSVSTALTFSKPLLAYPAVTWLDTIVARFILNLLTNLMVVYLLLTGILLLTDTNAVLRMGPMIEALSLCAVLGLGIGTMNCLLSSMFPIWKHIWSIVTRPLFLASGVVFLYEDMPSAAQSILWYNPLLHITGIMRVGIYPSYDPQYTSPVYVLTVALGLLALGLVLLSRFHRDILDS